MRLENKTEEVAPFYKFFTRVLKYSLFSFALIAFSLGIGMGGYHYWGELEWLDAFHMSCMILTGMGPVAILTSNSAKLFSSFYALYSGVAFLSITAVFFSPIIHRILHILNVDTTE